MSSNIRIDSVSNDLFVAAFVGSALQLFCIAIIMLTMDEHIVSKTQANEPAATLSDSAKDSGEPTSAKDSGEPTSAKDSGEPTSGQCATPQQ